MSLDTKQFEDLELMLRSHGIILGAGLSDRQIEQAELIKHSDIQFDKIKKGIPFWGYFLE